jgi:hypothetical protein
MDKKGASVIEEGEGYENSRSYYNILTGYLC